MSVQSKIQDVLDDITVKLVDNSGGTASGTLADSMDGTGNNAASKTDVDARLVTLSDSLASLAAKQALIILAIDKIAARGVFK